jgi:hypothetical protein
MPANQSLILAGEPLPGTTAGIVNRGALTRVAIFEPGSATTLVVQADYYPHDVSLPMPRDGAASGASGSAYLTPVQLYARTQRGSDERPRAALLDVLA